MRVQFARQKKKLHSAAVASAVQLPAQCNRHPKSLLRSEQQHNLLFGAGRCGACFGGCNPYGIGQHFTGLPSCLQNLLGLLTQHEQRQRRCPARGAGERILLSGSTVSSLVVCSLVVCDWLLGTARWLRWHMPGKVFLLARCDWLQRHRLLAEHIEQQRRLFARWSLCD